MRKIMCLIILTALLTSAYAADGIVSETGNQVIQGFQAIKKALLEDNDVAQNIKDQLSNLKPVNYAKVHKEVATLTKDVDVMLKRAEALLAEETETQPKKDYDSIYRELEALTRDL